jgi:hypothetical protein
MEAVGRLAGGVAHDFNNLLTAINGYSDLLLRSLDRMDPRRADVEEIKETAGRAAGLTQQLLAFSRRQITQPTVVDLNQVVTNLEKMLRRLIGEDIQLITVKPRDLFRVRADMGQMEQVLLNLSVNARDAMPKGGHLTVETSNVDVKPIEPHEVPPGAYALLTVTDSGTGMDAATVSHLFEPFYTTKEKGRVHPGAGIGDGQKGIGARGDFMGLDRFHIDIAGFDSQMAAFGHGVAGVDTEVEKHLLHLAHIGPHAEKVSRFNGDQLNVLADQTPQHFFQVGHDLIEIHHSGLGDLPTTKSQQLLS